MQNTKVRKSIGAVGRAYRVEQHSADRWNDGKETRVVESRSDTGLLPVVLLGDVSVALRMYGLWNVPCVSCEQSADPCYETQQ
jgi:hypothetical protein